MGRGGVRKGGLALAAAAGGPLAFFSGDPARAAPPGYSRARFEELLGQWFRVGDDAHPTLELVEVAAGPPSAEVEQFTLVFRGHPGTELADAIHRLTPQGEAPMDLHLVPSGGDAAGSYFAASFALLAGPGPGGCAGAGGVG